MKNFVLIGAGGYIAPRHMKAIKETGNNLLAALDKHDSVGIMDSYFPNCAFFTEFERFDRHVEKLKREGTKIDYVSVCSPNYLHDAHIRFGLRIGADVICEKPIVLNPWNVDALLDIEAETGKKVYSILQLRLHPAIKALQQKINNRPTNKKHSVSLQYITSRGYWYHSSWKGDIAKSGGIATNIGVHFFDMLIWVFGSVEQSLIKHHSNQTAAGTLTLQHAEVDWELSIDYDKLPNEAKNAGSRTFRLLKIDEEAFEFSEGFTDLHTESYKQIMNGTGYGLLDTKPSIDLVHKIREYKA
jgi:UDP-N-acetyl-2-amino-2-deoxyglucuronate dehydrogenase